MPVCFVNASSVGCLSGCLSSTSMYSGQLDQTTFFSVSEWSLPAGPAFALAVAGGRVTLGAAGGQRGGAGHRQTAGRDPAQQ